METLRQLGSEIEQLKLKLSQRNRKIVPVRDVTSNYTLGGIFNMFGGVDKRREEDLQQFSLTEEEQQLREKKQRFDRSLADECLWCGPSLAETIMMPFSNEVERESWKV